MKDERDGSIEDSLLAMEDNARLGIAFLRAAKVHQHNAGQPGGFEAHYLMDDLEKRLQADVAICKASHKLG